MADDTVIEDVPSGMVMKGKDRVREGFTGFLEQLQTSRYTQVLSY
ncbi:MAG: hypothetical protein M3258_09155 [Thermoproteota archaeon]|nr:hypothetical protein [Thermoproteota archaeon]